MSQKRKSGVTLPQKTIGKKMILTASLEHMDAITIIQDLDLVKGVDFVAEELNVNEVILLKGKGFHLDTFFTPVLNKNGRIVALIVCEKILHPQSKKNLFNYADENNIPIFDIPENDALGTKKQTGKFAVNALPLPGVLFRSDYFSNPAIDDQLSKLGIKIKIKIFLSKCQN